MDDIAVPQHHRVGAHRARRHPALAVAVPVAVVVVVAVVFVWALTAFLGGGGEEEPLGLATGSPLPTAGEATGEEPSAAPSPAETGAAPTSQPLPSADPAASPSPEPSPDRTVPVTVLNSTATVGLAAGAAESLEGSGWAIAEVGNFGDGEIPTTVFYNGPELAATAAAVAADLGAGSAQESVDYSPGTVTVVLGSDYSAG